MPTYEYICNHCGHEFEQFQSITAKTLRKCPDCGRLGLKRLIGSGAAIIFKGSGFYETDYRSESYKKAADNDKVKPEKSDTEKKTGAETKTEIKSKDSKPEKKATAGADDKKVSA
jgi:putative FmdB family regulatory protein